MMFEYIILIETLVLFLGIFLWCLDDPYIQEAKLLGSKYGFIIMKFSFIALLFTILFYNILK